MNGQYNKSMLSISLISILLVLMFINSASATGIEASDAITHIQYSNNIETSSNSLSPANLKEITINNIQPGDSLTGSWMIFFEAKCQFKGAYAQPDGCGDDYSTMTYIQVYKNNKPWGNPHGILTSSYPAEYAFYTEQFNGVNITPGDKVQLYVWNSDPTHNQLSTYVRNFGIIFKVTEDAPPIPLITPTPIPKTGSGISGVDESDTAYQAYTFSMPKEPFLNLERRETREIIVPYKTYVTYYFRSPELSIYELSVSSNINELDTPAQVEDLKGLSTVLYTKAPGTVYKYTNINTGIRVLINGIIRFKVSQTWMNTNVGAGKQVAIERWSGSQWTILDTREIKRDSNYVYFEANTSAFSHFAITTNDIPSQSSQSSQSSQASKAYPTTTVSIAKAVQPTIQSTAQTQNAQYQEPKKAPGFDGLMALVALSIVPLVLPSASRKRR